MKIAFVGKGIREKYSEFTFYPLLEPKTEHQCSCA